MADIEDRILKHSHAFEGLLSLVPVVEKRKLTKEEKREEAKKAKKAKLNHETGAGVGEKKGPVQKGDKEGKKKEQKKAPKESTETPATETTTSTEKDVQPKGKKQKKQKQKPDAEKKKDGGDNNTEEGEKTENTNKSGKVKPKPVQKPPLQKKQKPAKPPPEDTTPPSPSSSTTDPTDPPTASTTPEAEPTIKRLEITPSARAEARARLVAQINTLRIRRKAPATGTRATLLEARDKKEAARKERKKALRLSQKLDSEATADTTTTPASLIRPPPMTEKEVEKAANNFTFGAIQFDDGQELDHTLGDFKKTKKRKGPTDVMGQIKQVEAKRARLETMDPEKREKIYEKEMWSKALKQTAGEKVRDDEKLLKKALKRQEVQKKKSEREWKERKDSVAKGIAIRQKKREENINARKEQKKLGKAGMKKKAKAAKSGGKKKAPQHSKNKGGKSDNKSNSKPSGKTTSGGGGGKKFGR